MALIMMHPDFAEKQWVRRRPHFYHPYRESDMAEPVFLGHGFRPLGLLMDIFGDQVDLDEEMQRGGTQPRMGCCCGGKNAACGQNKRPAKKAEADSKKLTSKSAQVEQKCELLSKWRETVELPAGYDVSDIKNIKIVGDKLILSLHQSYNYPWAYGRASISVPVTIPADVIHGSISIDIRNRNKVEITGFRKNQEEKSSAIEKTLPPNEPKQPDETETTVTGKKNLLELLQHLVGEKEPTDTRRSNETDKEDDIKKTVRNPLTKWSTTVELPLGFDVSDIEDMKREGNKAVIRLNQSLHHPWGFGRTSVSVPVTVPEDVIDGTLALYIVSRNKLQLIGLKKDTTDPQSVDSLTTDRTKAEKPTSKASDSTEMVLPIDTQQLEDDDQKAEVASSQLGESETQPMDSTSNDAEDAEDICEPTEEQAMVTGDTTGKSEEVGEDTMPDIEVVDAEEFHREQESAEVTDARELSREQEIAEAMQTADQQNEASCTIPTSDKKTPDQAEVAPFQAKFYLGTFQPEDIEIRLRDHKLYIDAGLRKDTTEGVVHHELHRTVDIPARVDEDALRSKLTEDGELVISAPYLSSVQQERILNIEHYKNKA